MRPIEVAFNELLNGRTTFCMMLYWRRRESAAEAESAIEETIPALNFHVHEAPTCQFSIYSQPLNAPPPLSLAKTAFHTAMAAISERNWQNIHNFVCFVMATNRIATGTRALEASIDLRPRFEPIIAVHLVIDAKFIY